jgi:phage tape measure protein
MAGKLGSLNINLALDSVQFSQGLERAQKSAVKFATTTNSNLNSIEQNVQRLTRSIQGADRLVKINLFAGIPVKKVLSFADEYTELGNRIKLVTKDQTEQAAAMRDIFDISTRTYQSLSATGQVYTKLANAEDQLGRAQKNTANLTETVNKTIALSGVSAASAEAGLLQFSQALDKGVLNGQELTSVMTQTPALAKAIADGLGVPIGALKEMGENGELTAERVIGALEKVKDKIDIDYATTVTTVGNALEVLNTKAVKFVGELDKSVGGSDKVAKSILVVANNMDAAVAAGLALIGVWGAIKASRSIHDYASQRVAITQEKQLAQAARERAEAMTETTSATLRQTTVDYQAMKARVDSLRIAQQQTIAERELLATQLQGSNASARAAGMVQYNALKEQEKIITQQLVVAERELTASKLALRTAYAENAVTQAAANAGLARSSILMTSYRAVVRGATAELNLMKTAFLSNPIMLGVTAVTTLAAFAGYWLNTADATEEATQKAKEYTQSIDTSKEALQQMTAVALNKQVKDLEESQVAFKKNVEDKKRLIAELEKQIESLNKGWENYGSDSWYQFESEAEQRKKIQGKLIDLTYELENAQKDLDKSTEQLTATQDELNEKLGKGAQKTPDVTNKVLVFSGTLDDLKLSADDAKKSLNELFSMMFGKGTTAIKQADGTIKAYASDKLSAAYLKDMARLRGEQEETKLKGKALYQHRGLREGQEKGYTGQMLDDYVDQYTQTNLAKDEQKGGKKKGSKVDYDKQYTQELGEMQKKLSEAKANAQDIALFGQPSQYQEVNKLTQDIVANAEKYAYFGAEGLAKLKSLASQIDAANQEVAINQFAFDNSEKLQAMEFELTLLGKTRQEQELMQYNHQLDLEAAKLKIGMTDENIAKLDQEIAKLKERRAEIQKQNEEARGSAAGGFKKGLQTIEDDVGNVSENMSNVTVRAFGSMSDALTDFVMTGKADFKGMAVSIMRDISNMIIKMMLFNAIKSAASAVGFGFADGGLVGAYATGGHVQGPGTGTSDSIPAWLSNNEFVMTSRTVDHYGVGFMNALNQRRLPKFANGGRVGGGGSPSYTGLLSRQANGDISVKVINNGEPMEARVSREQRGDQVEITVELMKKIADSRIAYHQQESMRQGGAFAR